MSLKYLDLKPTYRSDRNDVLNEFYVPCLRECNRYFRAVGYFSSRSIAALLKGIYPFIKNGGIIKVVASPILSDEDIEAIKVGHSEQEALDQRQVFFRVSDN